MLKLECKQWTYICPDCYPALNKDIGISKLEIAIADLTKFTAQ
ncbi:MAG: hypothetical protein ACLQF0_06800 [Dissulfurispiraceae bacterium]